MITNFRSSQEESQSLQPLEQVAPTPESHQEAVRITVTGSPDAVKAIIHDLHGRRFAEVNDWCPPMPTGKVGEVIRVLVKRMWVG